MNVGAICNREVVIVHADASLREAAKLMRRYHTGNVVVVREFGDNRIPIGILTDRDIVIGVLAEDLSLDDSMTVQDVMSADLLTAREDDDVMDTLKKMRDQGVRRVPVINEEGGLEGILAMDDLIDLIAEQIGDLAGLIMREQRRERQVRI